MQIDMLGDPQYKIKGLGLWYGNHTTGIEAKLAVLGAFRSYTGNSY